jgi:glutathione S-transferase
MTALVLVGRSSSHFTRTARIFALDLSVPHTFRPVIDILSTEASTFAGNPALKVPVLVDEQGALFGTENICAEIARRSGRRPSVVLRGDVRDRVVANAEEMVLHVMSSEVTLIMAKIAGDARLAPPKVARSVENALLWLDDHLDAVVAALPNDRAISFVEVALFCTLTHLPFRQVTDPTPFARLVDFAARFGERESARTTEYRFDAG